MMTVCYILWCEFKKASLFHPTDCGEEGEVGGGEEVGAEVGRTGDGRRGCVAVEIQAIQTKLQKLNTPLPSLSLGLGQTVTVTFLPRWVLSPLCPPCYTCSTLP